MITCVSSPKSRLPLEPKRPTDSDRCCYDKVCQRLDQPHHESAIEGANGAWYPPRPHRHHLTPQIHRRIKCRIKLLPKRCPGNSKLHHPRRRDHLHLPLHPHHHQIQKMTPRMSLLVHQPPLIPQQKCNVLALVVTGPTRRRRLHPHR